MTLPPALPEGVHTAAKVAVAIYRRLTPESWVRAIWLWVGLQVMLVFVASTFLGIIVGASAGVEGAEFAPKLAELWQTETDIWADMAAGSPALRAAWGFFHWMVVVAIWLAAQGAKLGYAFPSIGYVMEYSVIVIYALIGLAVLQVIRVIEWAVLEATS